VAATARDPDLEVVLPGHQRTGAGADPAGGVPGHVVQPEHRLDREPLEQPVGDHRPGAETVLLGGLEHQVDGAGEASFGRENVSGTEDHRHVPVVAAGVHDPVVARAVRAVAAFGER